MPPRLVLASTSPYRRALLARLGVPFDAVDPGVDEGRAVPAGLPPAGLAAARARAKAAAVAVAQPEAVVVGSDQVCALGSETFGKPGDRAGAIAQLSRLRGRTHELITAVSVFASGRETAFADVSRLTMRPLADDEIARYVDLDRPFDCAGSYKLERAGIALFDAIATADATAITGLPLLALCRVLRGLGFALP